jgi:hypothetical protein
VDAKAEAGIHSVEFYVDHQRVGIDFSPPYAHDWDTITYSNRRHSVAAVVVDKLGKRRSVATEVIVKNASVFIDVLRSSDQAWLVRRDYAMIDFVAENIDTEIVDSCVLYRKAANGSFEEVTSFDTNIVAQRTFVHQDRFLDQGKSYTYKAEIRDKKGQVIATSQEVTI